MILPKNQTLYAFKKHGSKKKEILTYLDTTFIEMTELPETPRNKVAVPPS